MIISEFYATSDQYLGMPVVIQSGLCTSDDGTKNALRAFENEAVQLVRIPRRSGLVVKELAGGGTSSVKTQTIRDQQVGTFRNMIQMGRTQFRFVAPKQPAGFPFSGRMILQYQITWLQLEE